MTSTVRSSRGPSAERGVALLIVITVLVTLVMIAVPFVLAMRHGQERTEALSAQERADFEVELLLAQAKQFIQRSSVSSELARAAGNNAGAGPGRTSGKGGVGTDEDPNVDSLEEIALGEEFRKIVERTWLLGWGQDANLALRAKGLANRKLGPMTDDRGSIWSAEAQDAQARVHVNGASPFLLANLMGSALLAEEVDGQASDIPVQHVVVSKIPGAEGFPKAGGTLRIGREVVIYTSFDGQTFRGCTRGAYASAPLGLNGGADKHKRGTPVIAYDAFKLATHLICSKPGHLNPFENLGALRRIADWGGGVGISVQRLQAIEPYLTVWARRETAEWLAQQLSLEALPKGDGAGQDEILIRDDKGGNPSGATAYYGPGVIVRLSDNLRTVYQVVDTVGDSTGQREKVLTLAGSVGADDNGVSFEGGKTRIEALAPTPVNINTAPREVLYAVMANLHLWAADIGDEAIVTPALAWTLAERIVLERAGGAVKLDDGVRVGGPFRHAEDYGRWLKKLTDEHVLSTQQRWALYTNAINPHQSNLGFGTAPWCYRTLDVYHLEARVAVNDRAGNLLATSAQREVIEVGADQPAAWTLDTQEQFEARIGMGSGGKWFASYPFGVTWSGNKGQVAYVQPPLRAPKHLREDLYPSTLPTSKENGGRDMGDIRLAPSRVRLPGAVVLEQHFDDTTYTDGYFTESHIPWTHKSAGVLLSTKDDPFARPFSMSFWWRSYSDAEWTAFECGKAKFMNRYAIFVRDGSEGQELVFRVCGPTLEEKAAECYVPLKRISYSQGEWYHIHVSASGEDPSTMELLVDGVDVAKRRGMTYLTGGIGTDASDIPVESTEGFHLRGAIQIGTEIVEYDGLSSDAFRDVVRGARGTGAGDWPSGTPVRMLGYSLPLELDILAGGGSLVNALQKITAVRIDNVDDQAVTTASAGDGTTFPVPVFGIGPDRTSFTCAAASGGDPVKPLWGQSITDVLDAFGTKGIALMGSRKASNQAAGTGGGSGGPAGPRLWAPRGGTEAPPPGPKGPGGGIPPGTRPPSDPPPTGGPTPPGGTPGPAPGTPPAPPSAPPASGGSGEAMNGWEIVHYTRNGSNFTIERYKASPWQSAATPYFLVTHAFQKTDDYAWPAFLIPISVHSSAGGGGGYFDPSVPEIETKLRKYGGDGDARVLLGTTTPAACNECIRYSSTDMQAGAPGILFVQDRHIAALTNAFFGLGGAYPGGPTTTPTEPTPTPPDPPPGGGGPVPPDPNPPPPGGGPPAGTPMPGGGVPPGLRDPADPPPDPADPGTGGGGGAPPGGGGGGGAGGGGTTPGSGGGGGSGGGTASEPTEPTDDGEAESSETEGPGGGAKSGEAGEEGSVPGGSFRSTGEEPQTDSSGGGSNNDAEGDGPYPPEIEAPDKNGWDDMPPSPDENGSGLWREPAYGTLRSWSRTYFRGTNNTADFEHQSTGSAREGLFIPCFRVWEGFSGSRDRRMGRNDVITITDGAETPTRYPALVRWGDPTSDWVALDHFIESEMIQAPTDGVRTARLDGRGRPRVLKFPCGELPDEVAPEMKFAQSDITNSGVVTAFLDELFVWRHDTHPVGIVSDAEGVSATATDISLAPQEPMVTLEGIPGHDKDCGLFSLDGELIVYRSTRTDGNNVLVLADCVRGAFGTKARPHPRGGYGRFVFDVPVSCLGGNLNRDANSVPLMHARNWPKEGLVRIVKGDTAELVHYTAQLGSDLLMPGALDADDSIRGRGLFRGRFGSQALDHDDGEVVAWQPFRHWDRYTARRTEDDRSFSGFHDHPESGYLELSRRLRGAWWQRIAWVESFEGSQRLAEGASSGRGGARNEGTDTDTFMDVYVAVRFNPAVPWDTDRLVDLRDGEASTRGGTQSDPMQSLFVFSKMDGANRLEIESETADMRIFFLYKSNCWLPQDLATSGQNRDDGVFENAWKRTPMLQEITLEYVNRTTTRGGRTVLPR